MMDKQEQKDFMFTIDLIRKIADMDREERRLQREATKDKEANE